MTTAVTEIMTPERFAQGYTWSDYMAIIEANKERFQKNYADFAVKPEETEFFQAFNAKKGPVKMIAIAEDWCPDVVRGLPVGARLAEAAGFELRIFPRDKNLDLAELYKWRHEFLCVPIFVFFDKNWKELGHWTERPAIGYKFAADTRADLANHSEEEIVKIMAERRASAQSLWMHETVREIREQVLYRVL